MDKTDFDKLINFLEGYYSRKFNENEITAIKKEMQGYTYQKFTDELKTPLLLKVDYFTPQKLHKIVEENKELERFKESLGIKDFDELYEF